MFRCLLSRLSNMSPAVAQKLFVKPDDPSSYASLLARLQTNPLSCSLVTLLNAPYRPQSVATIVNDVLATGAKLSDAERVICLQRVPQDELDALWKDFLREGASLLSMREYLQRTRDPISSVQTLMNMAKSDPSAVSPEHFAASIAVISKADDAFLTAAQLLQLMPFPITASVLASFALTVGTGSELKYVIELFESSEGQEMSGELLTALLTACNRAKDYPHRLEIATNLYRRGRDDARIPPTVAMLEALMMTAAGLGDVLRQHSFFVEAQTLFGKENLTPLSYAANVRALATAGFIKDAVETLHILSHNKIPISIGTYVTVIENCVNDMDSVQRVLAQMTASDPPIPTNDRRVAIARLKAYHTLRKTSRVDHAMELMRSLPSWDASVLLQLSRIYESEQLPPGAIFPVDEVVWVRRVTKCVFELVGDDVRALVKEGGSKSERPVILTSGALLHSPEDVIQSCEHLFPRHDILVVPFTVMANLARHGRNGRGARYDRAMKALRHILRMAPQSLLLTLEDQMKALDFRVRGRDSHNVVIRIAASMASTAGSKRSSILSTSEKFDRIVKASRVPCDLI